MCQATTTEPKQFPIWSSKQAGACHAWPISFGDNPTDDQPLVLETMRHASVSMPDIPHILTRCSPDPNSGTTGRVVSERAVPRGVLRARTPPRNTLDFSSSTSTISLVKDNSIRRPVTRNRDLIIEEQNRGLQEQGLCLL